MIQPWFVLALSLGYVGLLFALAYYGDRVARLRARPVSKPVIYALSLAIYCTSWTFYGSVGLASRSGYDFLTIYIGPVLVFALGWALVRKIVRVSKAHNITSIADFIAARYGKSQVLAATVTLIAIVGILPYIALQLKAISTSFAVLTQYPRILMPSAAASLPAWGDTALVVSLVLALFAILFGTRNINATEHNEGMMLAIAFESIVKLVAFLSVGVFVTWGMFGGLGDLTARIANTPDLHRLFFNGVDGQAWVTTTGLAMAAIICLPRQFHVTVVENVNERDLKKAAWLFPLYLVAINVFVVPIAAAGLLTFGGGGTVDGDMFVLAVPMAGHQEAIALLAFLGGLSAATAMVIVESVAISNMVSNDLIMPIVLHRRRLGLSDREDMGKMILQIRRAAIVAFMLLAYFYYRLVGDTYALASIGLLSFAAMAQFAPALLGGLVWRGATQKGAVAGILMGFAVWVYTLLVPSLVQAGALPSGIVENGPFGIGLLRPQQLLGLRFDPLTHGVIWSLLANVSGYVLFSLLSVPKVIERLQANAFVDPYASPSHFATKHWHGAIKVAGLTAVAASYLGAERAQRSFEDFAARRGVELHPDMDADFDLIRHTERLLASAIGAASARVVMAVTLEREDLSTKDAMRLLDDATIAIQYNRDLLQSTLENVRQGISVFDKELRLVCWNRRFRDLLDLPAELVRIGIALEDIVRFNTERGEYGRGNPDDIVARELERYLGDDETAFEWRRPNGTVLEVRTGAMPGGYVTTYSDITERVRVAAQLAAGKENLELRVNERTAELMTLNAEFSRAKVIAEEANLGKTRFLAAASHDLLQPLNAARLYVSSLVERYARGEGEPGDAAGELVRKVDASLGSVEELLGTLLDISKLDAGGLVPERQDMALRELFEALELEFAPLAEKKGLDLRIVPSRLVVASDRHLLHRVLQNLLSNAVRYTTHGTVLMGVRRAGAHLLIQVWDSGCGIPRDKQSLVFKEFQRFASGPGTERGLGLGLSIVERIGRILDHPVSFRSEPDRGTVFTVRVPRARSDAVPLRAAPEPARPLQPVERAVVLCVDNEPSVLDGLRVLLEGWSWQVATATGIAAAIESDTKGSARPDLLIVDYHLDSSGNGLDCIVALRRHFGVEIPAVLTTADRSEAVKSRAQAMGLTILNKPIKPAALRALAMRTLAAREAAE